MNDPSHAARQLAVSFPGERRIHVGLATADLERSASFYETLLGTAPAKTRPGYVKFEPEDPSVNLTLNQVDGFVYRGGGPEHYGIQLKSVEAVEQAIKRFENAGWETAVQKETTCCYAVQDKVWVHDPDGRAWEMFVVLEADASSYDSSSSDCCNSGNDDSCGPQACADEQSASQACSVSLRTTPSTKSQQEEACCTDDCCKTEESSAAIDNPCCSVDCCATA